MKQIVVCTANVTSCAGDGEKDGYGHVEGGCPFYQEDKGCIHGWAFETCRNDFESLKAARVEANKYKAQLEALLKRQRGPACCDECDWETSDLFCEVLNEESANEQRRTNCPYFELEKTEEGKR